ncbi:MAG: homocysteine S-methyltransferase family protein, partial [Kiloniellales bacterium]|nr:homocysteine S-methyltransferase family protein [Kiloniellales bacterium]
MTGSSVTLLDGGMGRELQRRGLASVSGAWSAAALIAQPSVVREIHKDFIAAGAEVITTSNYAVVPFMLARGGLEDRMEELLSASVRLAREAREAAGRRGVRIAGSLPPLAQSYRPELVGASMEIEPLYRRIASILAPGIDLFLCETMSSGAEARSAVTAAADFGKPVWVSWTLDDEVTGRLRSGDSPGEAVAALEGLPVEAFLFNCCLPEAISAALPALRAATSRPIGAYANALTGFKSDYEMGGPSGEGRETPARDDLDPEA